ncbi:hypothetical protein TRFO_27635 [Tritrichomonas foetus]|uniref:Protein kinase domain-containing protein n=1 Tax=Tritrichomonas foetus TaxID=1144522 RepID=A0A1J4K5U0_9EUKA|nr:hypothetical protein TRFO_27635 [Tritrichomonas foetus]|eukprot:OHT04837.1 hypothetical protein TRFO_27635 [Tritrichomonas foetus]
MAEIVQLNDFAINISDFTIKKDNIENDFQLKFSIVTPNDDNSKEYLTRVFEVSNIGDQKHFFRDLSFMVHCKHPLISKLKGFSVFDEGGNPANYSILTEFPKNGFLIDFMKLRYKRFDNTAKSKYIYGVAIIGNFLHSRNIVHRCLAPPTLGVSENFDPILLMMNCAKSYENKLNETLQIGNFPWIAPELDTDEADLDPKQNFKADIFSFGCLIYILFTGKAPFLDSNIIKIIRNKEEPDEFIPDEMSGDMKRLLNSCWRRDPKRRPTFDEILLKLQTHEALFPDTDVDSFDQYVRQLLSFQMSSNICKIAPESLGKSVSTIYASVMTNEKMRSDPKILKSLYTIREQVETYTPIVLQCIRGRSSMPILMKVPAFMFSAALNSEINKIFGLPEILQTIQIDNEKLINCPYLTMEQLGVKNGSVLHVYNRFIPADEEDDCDECLLYLDIQFLGKKGIAYMPTNTVQMLLEDIHFLTRLPIGSIQMNYKGRQLKNNNYTMQSYGVKPLSTINVTTTYPNTPVTINIDISGVIGRTGIEEFTVPPITTILNLMEMTNVDVNQCFALFDGRELSPHEALIDLDITPDDVIEFNTNVTDWL